MKQHHAELLTQLFNTYDAHEAARLDANYSAPGMYGRCTWAVTVPGWRSVMQVLGQGLRYHPDKAAQFADLFDGLAHCRTRSQGYDIVIY